MNRVRRAFLLMAGIAAGLAPAACGRPAPVPQDHFYRLELDQPRPIAGGSMLDGSLQVERFAAAGLLKDRAIMHSNGSAEVHAYHYHAWTEVPSTMLQMQMVRYLRAARLSPVVVTPDKRLEPDYILRGHILRLEQRTASPPAGIVELELSLERQRDQRLVWLHSYRQEIPAADASVPAGVAAMSQAVEKVYALFLEDVTAQGRAQTE